MKRRGWNKGTTVKKGPVGGGNIKIKPEEKQGPVKKARRERFNKKAKQAEEKSGTKKDSNLVRGKKGLTEMAGHEQDKHEVNR